MFALLPIVEGGKEHELDSVTTDSDTEFDTESEVVSEILTEPGTD